MYAGRRCYLYRNTSPPQYLQLHLSFWYCLHVMAQLWPLVFGASYQLSQKTHLIILVSRSSTLMAPWFPSKRLTLELAQGVFMGIVSREKEEERKNKQTCRKAAWSNNSFLWMNLCSGLNSTLQIHSISSKLFLAGISALLLHLLWQQIQCQ